ncbi:MAG: RsmD family RNA methyltransferase [Alphaproteobacteria bacterium]|nr:RsmD family RNA methyltransferase [Alphaproteobacteria bacterium]
MINMNSHLQIISGKYRGRKLVLPTGARPTQNRARIALFNMLESGIIDPNTTINVWDTFGGSGAFGIECLSRYDIANVVITDVSAVSMKTIRKNLELLSIDNTARTEICDAFSVISKYGPVSNLIFLDPPYADAALGEQFVKKLGKIAPNNAILIWEQDGVNFTTPCQNWKILRDKKYGRARFLILQKISEQKP